MKKAMNIVLGRRISSPSEAPSCSSWRHSISESPRHDVASSRNYTLHLGGMMSTRSLFMWGKPQGHMVEPHVRPRRSTRSSTPPPYTPRHFKLVFIIKAKDQPLKEAWRKEEEIMLLIRFDLSFSLSLFFSYVQICVCKHFPFYFQHVCDSSSFLFSITMNKVHHHVMIINMDGKLCQVGIWWPLPICLYLYLIYASLS
jgi:hypothetical protein